MLRNNSRNRLGVPIVFEQALIDDKLSDFVIFPLFREAEGEFVAGAALRVRHSGNR